MHEEEFRYEALRRVGQAMLLAARTAPKGRGMDLLELQLVEGDDIQKLASKMREMGLAAPSAAFFTRDAGCIVQAPVVLLLGTRTRTFGLPHCGLCGFADCDGKNQHPEAPCALNAGDLGIAVGSAVSVAMDHRVDNRVMFTIGRAAMLLGFFSPEVKIAYGIPLSATGKNIFFDRK